MRRFFKKIHNVLMILVLSAFLQGCMPTMLIGAGAAAAVGVVSVVVFDHRGGQTKQVDSDAEKIANQKLNDNKRLNDTSHVYAVVFEKNLVLLGQTPSAKDRKIAVDLMQSVSGINDIYNEIEISGPTSLLTRSGDSWVTAKIKTELLLSKSVKSTNVTNLKVVTENGTVYLIGTLTREQTAAIVSIVNKVSGVQKIVKMIKYWD